MAQLVYLAAADRQMENFLDDNAFDRSLLLNTLFQSGILIPDIFFAISAGLELHLKNPNLSLLEACITEGIVVPSFRDPSTSSFTEALQVIGKQEIQGVRDSAERTMERLQRAAEANKQFRALSPKTALGTSFSQRLNVLQQTSAPLVGPTFGVNMSQGLLQRFWDLTQPWRDDAINNARDATAERFGREAGVRRGEIFNAVARSLSPGNDTRIDDIATLLAAYPEKPELRVFLQWVCEIYGYNQALELGSIPNLPAYNTFSPVSLGTQAASAPPLIPTTTFLHISETVDFPPLHLLKRIAPKDVLAVRREKGAQYFADLNAWQKDPTSAHNEAQVRKSLRGYARELVKWSKAEAKTSVSLLVSRLPPQWRWWARAAAAATTKEVAAVSHEAAVALGVFVSALDGCYALYQWHNQRSKAETIDIFGPNLAEVNVGPPEGEAE